MSTGAGEPMHDAPRNLDHRHAIFKQLHLFGTVALTLISATYVQRPDIRSILFIIVLCAGLGQLLCKRAVGQQIMFVPLAGYEYGALTSVSRDSGIVNPYHTVEGTGTSHNSTVWIGMQIDARDVAKGLLDLAIGVRLGFGVGRFVSFPYTWHLTGTDNPVDTIGTLNELDVRSTQTQAQMYAMVTVRPYENLMLAAGPWAGSRFGSATVVVERLLEPGDQVFRETSTRERTISSREELESAPLRFGVRGGIGYEIPVSPVLALRPMLSMWWDGRAFLEGLGARAWSLGGEVAAAISLSPREAVATSPPPDSLFLPPGDSHFMASVNLFNTDPHAPDSSVATVRLQRSGYELYTPLLPFVFFDGESDELPERYVRIARETADTTTRIVINGREPVAIYQNILNILGQRMRDEPSASITLAGAANSDDLRRARARRVRQYLHEIWGIDTSRMAIDTVLWSGCSQGMTECVRIIPSRAALLAPVVSTWLIQDHIMPGIGLARKIQSRFGVREWNIIISQGDRDLLRLDHDDEMSAEISAVLPASRLKLDSDAVESLTARLHITDFAGSTFTVEDELGLQLSATGMSPNREMRICLLLPPDPFCPEYQATNQALLSSMLPAVRDGARVRISSRCSDEQKWCAREVATEFLDLLASHPTGPAELRMVNEPDEETGVAMLPEEALYARSVRIAIELPQR